MMARLLLDLGAEVEGIGSTTLGVRCPEIVRDEPDPSLVGRLRGSVLLLGPLLARRGRAVSVEEPLEVEADRDEGAERGEQRHGKDGCRAFTRSPIT